MSRSRPSLRRHRPTSLRLLVLAAIVACSGDDARSHRYMSPPPTPPRTPAVAGAPVPEPALGSVPSARIMAIRTAGTGAPASLEAVREPLELLVVVSRGRAAPATRPVRVELALHGGADTVLVAHIGAEVPLVMALPFHLTVGGPEGLRPGRYEARARLVGVDGGVMAESVPAGLIVRP